MFKQTKITALVSALAAGAVFAGTVFAAPLVNRPIARDAGEIRSDVKGHSSIGIKNPLARHGADDRQPDDRGGRRGGRRISADSMDQLARHGADDKQRDDRGGRRG